MDTVQPDADQNSGANVEQTPPVVRAPLTLDDLYKSLAVRELHQKVFPQYKNIHQGKDVVLVATGPTLKDYEPIQDVIHIGVNKSFRYDKVKFDFLFLQDYSVSKDYIEEFCAYDTQKFLGILHDFWSHSIVPESIALRHGIQRYYVAHPDDLTRPAFDISTSIFWDDYSVVFPVMQFILWTNPKRVYLVGCDCSTGYFDGHGNPYNADKLVKGWATIKEFAQRHYPETEIISVNPVGLKGMFSDI